MRVALAATLFAQPDLLLLDEPTNYLDLEGTLWLQDHLARYPATLIVISHDRDLLDSAVGHILSLEQQKLTLWRGGYSAFARQRSERVVLDQKLIKKQETQRKHLQAFVDRFRAKATKARQAQSRLKMLAKLEPIAALGHRRGAADQYSGAGQIVVAADHRHRRRFRRLRTGQAGAVGLSLRIDNDDRIALIGANGNGKSTFVKLIADRLEPMQGTITRAATLRIGYFAQHQLDELDPQQSPYDHVRRLMPDARGSASARARGIASAFRARPATPRWRSFPAARRRGCCSASPPSKRRISSSSTSRPTISTSTAAAR